MLKLQAIHRGDRKRGKRSKNLTARGSNTGPAEPASANDGMNEEVVDDEDDVCAELRNEQKVVQVQLASLAALDDEEANEHKQDLNAELTRFRRAITATKPFEE